MSRARQHMSLVVDEVLAHANIAAQRRASEGQAIKIAEALPKTEMARNFRALADEMRTASDDLSYADFAGVL